MTTYHNQLKPLVVASMLAFGPLIAVAAETAIDLKWSQLVPQAGQKEFLRSKSFLSGANPAQQDYAPPPTADDKPWLSQKRLQPSAGSAPVVAELDGKRIKIGGYVVPLELNGTAVKEFLLVPFVGACIHVPPPPANQIIYVKADKAFEIKGEFDPVYVTGVMATKSASTGLADTGYSLQAETVDTRSE